MVNESQPEWVTVSELTEILKCSPDTVYKLIKQKNLGEAQGIFHPFQGKRNYRIHLQSFLNWRNGVKHFENEKPLFDPITIVKEMLGVLLPFRTAMHELATALQASIGRLEELYDAHQEETDERIKPY